MSFRTAGEDASVPIIVVQKQSNKERRSIRMELTIYTLLEFLWKLASNHNETFVTDTAAELNVEETQES
jgi:hypothetical protein